MSFFISQICRLCIGNLCGGVHALFHILIRKVLSCAFRVKDCDLRKMRLKVLINGIIVQNYMLNETALIMTYCCSLRL